MDHEARKSTPFPGSAFSPENTLFVYALGRSFYVCNHRGRRVVTQGFDFARVYGDIAAVHRSDKVGLLSATGEWLLPLAFSSISFFHNGLAVVGQNGRSGIVNRHGEWALSLQSHIAKEELFVRIGAPHKPREYSDRILCWMDPKIHDAFEAIGTFYSGTAAARKDGRWGIVDLQGRWLIAPRFDEAFSYPQRWENYPFAWVKLRGRRVTIDCNGAIMRPRDMSSRLFRKASTSR